MSMPLSVNFASRLNQRKLPALRAIQLKLGRMGTLQSADKTKDHAMHGLLFCWIPAATYSPGFTVRKGRLPSPLKRLGILSCSLGFRFASSPTGRAHLQPVFSQALYDRISSAYILSAQYGLGTGELIIS